ncbi:hypothetical protein CTI12_AA134470 [Artemisia annua]|uniref:Uncharacterized protein n=1 Tax=Artemisia annua TaxID=35608 RepID=A0A2U1PMZ9_ARTAN|nr:hypothetical protein CTI12_AA134470 [Artemisia annua]
MSWNSPEDAMPWVGLYVCVASLICTLAMAADAFQGFRQWKLWFPCNFFTINAASITLIAIALKLPVDLTTDVPGSFDLSTAKYVSVMFLVTMLANFLPSLGLMDDKELLMNIVALGILIISIVVNVWIQFSTGEAFSTLDQILVVMIPLTLPLSIALTVPALRRILEHRYKELHSELYSLPLNGQHMKFSYKELIRYVRKYWMMAKTGNPQFAIACSPISSALGVICPLLVLYSFIILSGQIRSGFWYGESNYRGSIYLIIYVQSIGVVVASIAPIFRCLTTISYYNLSKKWSKNHLNVFRIEKHWVQTLQQWKRSHFRSHIPGRHCKIVFHYVKNIILNIIIGIQMTVVVICKVICLVPRSFLILLSCCCYFCKSVLRRFKQERHASNSNARSDIQEYTGYVLQIEEEAKLSKRLLRNTLKSITRLLHESQKKEPISLIKLLQKSTGFNGIVEFDNGQVPPLHSEETPNSWSLVVVTLTAIAIALPSTAHNQVKGLLSSMREGLQIIRHIEESLNENSDLVNARNVGRRLWTEVEVRWLQIDLQKMARKGKSSKEILNWLCDESVKNVILFKIHNKRSIDDSFHKFIVASSMYKISQTTLFHCNGQEHWPNDEELFEWISTIIADILCACFTNLPRVIKMKCHHDAIEKREDSIRTAAQLLGRSKKILKILKARQLPNLDVNSMAYIDKWKALQKSELPSYASLNQVQPVYLSPNEPVIVNIGV